MWQAIIGVGMSAAAGAAARSATLSGAAAQNVTEEQARKALTRRYLIEKKTHEPFREVGEKAVPLYEQAVRGEFDVTQSPMYKMQAQMIQDEMQDAPAFVRDEAMRGLGVREGEMAKSRLMDQMKIGVGEAGSAGRSAISFGNAMTQSMQRGYGALAQGQLTANMQQQNTWMGAMESLSGLPAAREYSSYNSPFGGQDMNAQAKLPGGKTSSFTNYDLMY